MNPQRIGPSLNQFKPENVFLWHAKLFAGARRRHDSFDSVKRSCYTNSVIFRSLPMIVIVAFVVTGCTELGDVLLAPDEPVVYVEDHPFPSVFDPYYNEPKIYRQPRYYYESTSKKRKGNRIFKTTKVKDEYGNTVYKKTTSHKKKRKH
jgi:hypothetical protein